MKSPKPKPTRRAKPALKKSVAALPAAKHILRLFVAGATARSRQAILRVRELCAVELKDLCELEVIDIYQQPALARDNQIVATPTLIVEFPPPVRRFIGNLANITGLFAGPDLVTKGKIAL
ncbi:MAG: circadian clock KaiB family protein [Chthoniobacteraceae bacterium]